MEKMSKDTIEEFRMDMLKHLLCGFNLPTDNELEIMKKVSSTLKEVKSNKTIARKSADSSIEEGLLSMGIFSKSYIYKLKKIIFYTYEDLSDNDFRAMIELNKNKLKVREIMMPEKTNILSPIWIGHECIHCLKDTNYNEYINKHICSEVLTLFYEILVSKTIYKDVHDIWKKERLNILFSDKENYELAIQNLNDKEDSDVYNFIMYSYGQYLASYYYALNLFSRYKDNPKEVAKLINKVLKHKMTTLDVLKKLDIYKINKEHVNIYKLEHSNL